MSSASAPPFFFFFFFFLLPMSAFFHQPVLGQEENAEVASGAWEMTPVATPRFATKVVEAKRRRLGNFRICAICTCCGGPRRLCLPSSCCYAINCNIPNRPFGFCSFTPKTCNCFGCHL